MNYKENIRTYYHSLTTKESEHLNWYILEHLWLRDLVDKYNKPLEFLCASCAVLSINKKWSETKKLLIEYLDYGEIRGLTIMQSKLKQLEDCNLEYDCIMSILNGKKIQNFYANLLRPYASEYVTIDRHAARIAGFNGKITSKKYEEIKNAYIEVAKELNMLPNKLQALLWCNFILK